MQLYVARGLCLVRAAWNTCMPFRFRDIKSKEHTQNSGQFRVCALVEAAKRELFLAIRHPHVYIYLSFNKVSTSQANGLHEGFISQHFRA